MIVFFWGFNFVDYCLLILKSVIYVWGDLIVRVWGFEFNNSIYGICIYLVYWK